MAANTAPIYPRSPRIARGQIPVSFAAITRTDGVGTIGTDLVLLDSAATDGTFYRHMIIKVCAISSGVTTSATVIRLFHSTQSSGATTAANTGLIAELQIPVVTAASTTVSLPEFVVPLNFALQSGKHLLVGSSITPGANVVFQCHLVAGDY